MITVFTFAELVKQVDLFMTNKFHQIEKMNINRLKCRLVAA